MLKNKKIAIIGGGLSAAYLYKHLNIENQVTIFEKSRGLGGRLAAKRIENGNIPHGPAYILSADIDDTVIQELKANGIHLQTEKINRFEFIDKQIKYCSAQNICTYQPKLNQILKDLCQTPDVIFNSKISAIVKPNNSKTYVIIDESGGIYDEYDLIISTIPAKQFEEIHFENIELEHQVKLNINKVTYNPCFVNLFNLDINQYDTEQLNNLFTNTKIDNQQTSKLEVKFTNHDFIDYISLQINKKTNMADNFTIPLNLNSSIYMQATWTQNNLDIDTDLLLKKTKSELNILLKQLITTSNIKTNFQHSHRWSYSTVTNSPFSSSFKLKDQEIYLSSDWTNQDTNQASRSYGFSNAIRSAQQLLNLLANV